VICLKNRTFVVSTITGEMYGCIDAVL